MRGERGNTYDDGLLALAVFDGVARARWRVSHERQKGLDDMERGDMRGVEIFEVFALKLEVFQRGEGGE